jgi:cobalt-zinc-cadmium efflux system protein
MTHSNPSNHSHAHPDQDDHHDHDSHHDHHDHHGHHHGHHHHGPANYNRAFAIGLTLNVGFVVIEVVFGLLANSIALVADAGHNLSDVLGLVLAWVASILVQQQPSSRRTYGWRRSSILAAFFNAVFLLFTTGAIAWEAVQRFWHPTEVVGSMVIIVAAIGIAINTATALMFMAGRKNDLNIRAAFLHMAADALVSFGVVLAGVIILVTQWNWLDPAFSLVVSGLIVWQTWQVLADSFHLVMDGVPQGIQPELVKQYLQERLGVEQVHDLHIWAMSTTEIALTAHLLMPEGHPGDDFLINLCQDLQQYFGIHHTTVQIELGDSNQMCVLQPDHVV